MRSSLVSILSLRCLFDSQVEMFTRSEEFWNRDVNLGIQACKMDKLTEGAYIQE